MQSLRSDPHRPARDLLRRRHPPEVLIMPYRFRPLPPHRGTAAHDLSLPEIAVSILPAVLGMAAVGLIALLMLL
ncbi:hypothetical protein D3272_04830 [Lichenibacterium ramalinae]|uniref:Uncharacterized protein n=1 Tax=Lichenibacterium ramalinae TaxID=2316527 RepID=A0A4Q2RHR3_9HYPH|nr:hypothetical protein D3272_04830 [Lichenibacterium ramalinae]